MLSINNNHWQDIQIDIDIWQIAYHWQVFHIDQLHCMSVWYSTNNDVQLYRLCYIILIPTLLYILPVVVILICNLFGVAISSMGHYSKLSPANIENLHLSQCQLCRKPPFIIQEVVIMTTYSATIDDKVGIMTNGDFQCFTKRDWMRFGHG